MVLYVPFEILLIFRKKTFKSHEADETWSFEEKYQSQLYSLYRDKITMEAAGEIWIEEESPIFNQMKDNTSVTAVEVKVSSLTKIFKTNQKFRRKNLKSY